MTNERKKIGPSYAELINSNWLCLITLTNVAIINKNNHSTITNIPLYSFHLSGTPKILIYPDVRNKKENHIIEEKPEYILPYKNWKLIIKSTANII